MVCSVCQTNARAFFLHIFFKSVFIHRIFTTLLAQEIPAVELFLSVLLTAPLNCFQFISFSGGTHMGGIYRSTFSQTAPFLFVQQLIEMGPFIAVVNEL